MSCASLDEAAQIAQQRERRGGAAHPLVAHQLDRRRRRSRHEARRLGRLGHVGREIHQHLHQVDARDAVDHAVMDLRDQREAVLLDALDDPDLPERSRAVEMLLHHARREPLQLLLGAGTRQARVPHVVFELEVLVVDPHRVVLERDPREALAIARDLVQRRADHRADLVGVDAAVGSLQRSRLEDHRRGDVHVGVRLLEHEERVVERGEAVVGVAGHGSAHRLGDVQQQVEEPHRDGIHEDVAQLPERRVPLLARQRAVEDLGDRAARCLLAERVEDLLADLRRRAGRRARVGLAR